MMYFFISLWMVFFGCAHASPDWPMAQAPDGFWKHWGDGQAELNGYVITQPRYGEVRKGEAIFVFVTETFTHKQRVKSDGGHSDEYPVIKLNDIRDFQTGVYDYNAMTSAFVRLDGKQAIGLPTKISFSMQEWCGHAWDQWSVDHNTFTRIGHSYFDGEADVNVTGTLQPQTVFADNLPILVRGLTGEWLTPGQTAPIKLIPQAIHTRMQHREPEALDVTIHREQTSAPVTVPAGTFDARIWRIANGNKSIAEFWVETAHPHRLLKWTAADGGTGMLTGTTRMKYWNKAREGDEQLRESLGLKVGSTP